ncbi:helix-turn-helix domain-containing protein [Enterococcus malodoratus]|uniref:helix-turn-helix domain-containing protein n=1 Tax=Enterococcus malodoratus TaxID=71451 RepID=UPI0039AF2D7A
MLAISDLHTFDDKQRIVLKANEFICLLPNMHLRKFISNYNITFPTEGIMPTGFTTLPSGCATLVIEQKSNNLNIYLEGPTTQSSFADKASQIDLMITVEFKPAGFYAFVGLSQNELLDENYSLELINPQFNKSILETIDQTNTIYDLVNNLDRVLLNTMSFTYPPELLQMLQRIKKSSGAITVKELSDDIHYSERHVNRLFKQYVGTNTKSFSRLVRINRSFHLLKKNQNSLNFVSDTIGYHDLPHFTHDFKKICGVTPQAYRNNMSVFYNNPIKF